jgi:hypothetical protein
MSLKSQKLRLAEAAPESATLLYFAALEPPQ